MSDFVFEERPYQREAVEKALSLFDAGSESVLIESPVGSGKTVMAVKLAQRLAVPQDRVFDNVNSYGNTSASSIGIAFDTAVRTGRLKRGDVVLLTAFGSGLTWGAMLLRY